MLNLDFKRIIQIRRIQKPFSFFVNLGFSESYATRIINNKIRKLDLNNLEELCISLHCTPNDLLSWTPKPKDANNENHPLISLKRDNKVQELTKMLETVPIDVLLSFENFIKKEMGKSTGSKNEEENSKIG